MLHRIKPYFKPHPDNLWLHSFIIGLVLLFSVAFSINQVSAIASIYVVFFGWMVAPLFWLANITIVITIYLSAYLPSYILKKHFPKQPYLLSLIITLIIMVSISAPVTMRLYELYLHTGF